MVAVKQYVCPCLQRGDAIEQAAGTYMQFATAEAQWVDSCKQVVGMRKQRATGRWHTIIYNYQPLFRPNKLTAAQLRIDMRW